MTSNNYEVCNPSNGTSPTTFTTTFITGTGDNDTDVGFVLVIEAVGENVYLKTNIYCI